MRHSDIPHPWNAFLSEIDAHVTGTLEFHCIGGFVVTTLYGLERQTADVDVLKNSCATSTRASLTCVRSKEPEFPF